MLSEVKPGCKLRLKLTHVAGFSYISCGSYTAFLVHFMRKEDNCRGVVTL